MDNFASLCCVNYAFLGDYPVGHLDCLVTYQIQVLRQFMLHPNLRSCFIISFFFFYLFIVILELEPLIDLKQNIVQVSVDSKGNFE